MITLLAGIFVVAAVAGVGLFLALQSTAPAEGSAEAGFARDMQSHHAQAVEMALIVREKSKDRVLRSVAYDIATSQQQQSGQMYAWLEMWQLPKVGRDKAMTWMQSMDHGMDTMDNDSIPMRLHPDGRMPGMATQADLQRLRTLSGKAAEVLFLQLMTTHHKAGVMMAEAILEMTDDAAVSRLAEAIRTSQAAEIRAMEDMLAERGASPNRAGG